MLKCHFIVSARQPSQKWYRKMMKRQYNAEREEYEAEYGEKENVPKPAKSYNNKVNKDFSLTGIDIG